jgi:hypothetical protein
LQGAARSYRGEPRQEHADQGRRRLEAFGEGEPMTHMEAMAAIAQGVINIAEANSCAIEKDSRIYRGMVKICEEEKITISRLQEIEKRLKRQTVANPKGAVNEALAIVKAMLRERTDPDFEG